MKKIKFLNFGKGSSTNDLRCHFDYAWRSYEKISSGLTQRNRKQFEFNAAVISKIRTCGEKRVKLLIRFYYDVTAAFPKIIAGNSTKINLARGKGRE